MTTLEKDAPWLKLFAQHAKSHPITSVGLVSALLVVFFLLLQSVGVIWGKEDWSFLVYALLGGSAGFVATSLGALPAFGLSKVPQSVEDSMLGFAAGMMLAAASFSLLLPGIEAAHELLQDEFQGGLLVVLGMGLGVMLMLGLDEFIPHEHENTGPCGAGHERCDRAWLFVFAIALHNLPEGMAVGVGFAQSDFSVGLPLATAIAIQDAPEGLAVALTLKAVGFSSLKSVLIAALSGALEPIGALVGAGLAGGYLIAYPLGLGLAAGAMIFVVSHEVIPETHRNGHQTKATVGLMVGFALMMVLDTALG